MWCGRYHIRNMSSAKASRTSRTRTENDDEMTGQNEEMNEEREDGEVQEENDGETCGQKTDENGETNNGKNACKSGETDDVLFIVIGRCKPRNSFTVSTGEDNSDPVEWFLGVQHYAVYIRSRGHMYEFTRDPRRPFNDSIMTLDEFRQIYPLQQVYAVSEHPRYSDIISFNDKWLSKHREYQALGSNSQLYVRDILYHFYRIKISTQTAEINVYSSCVDGSVAHVRLFPVHNRQRCRYVTQHILSCLKNALWINRLDVHTEEYEKCTQLMPKYDR